MSEGAEGPSPSQIVQKQEAVHNQKTEWNEDDIELLAPARKEFNENIQQVTQNLAELGDSGVEPEQGGKATKEKWGKLKEFFKSDAGKTLTLANFSWATAAGLTVAADYLLHGQVSTFTKVAGAGGVAFLSVLEGMHMAGSMKDEIKENFKKGWENIKRLTGGGKQEATPK